MKRADPTPKSPTMGPVLRFQRDISAAKVPLEKNGGSQPQARLPNPQHQSQEEVPTHLPVKISRDSVHQRETEVC